VQGSASNCWSTKEVGGRGKSGLFPFQEFLNEYGQTPSTRLHHPEKTMRTVIVFIGGIFDFYQVKADTA